MKANPKTLLVTGMGFLPDWISQHIKSAEIVCTFDVTEESLGKKVKGFDGVLFMQTVSHYKITRKIIESGDKLRFIQSGGVGYEQIDVDAATDHGVVVMNVPTATTVSVAEHAIALILACAKNIVKMHKTILAGGWRTMDFGVELSKKTLGIIGLGRIGKAVAERMRSFEMAILVFDPYAEEADVRKMGCKKVDLATLLKESDVITIHSPLTKETTGLIGEPEFNVMKSSAILVNTARGGVIDEKALIKALTDGRVGYAGLDVFGMEPVEKDNPLLLLENVILTPHSAVQNQDAMARLMNQNGIQVEKALNGNYENVVNPDVLKKLAKR
ncbi:MAG: hydroxyacid dehydrogenase [Candidatus Atabeyarchaeum deiterrae]